MVPGSVSRRGVCPEGLPLSSDQDSRGTAHIRHFNEKGIFRLEGMRGSTLRVDKRHLKRFLAATGAVAVCGYKTDVDWITSTAFEMMLLASMQANVFNGKGVPSIRRRATTMARLFGRELSFRMVTRFE